MYITIKSQTIFSQRTAKVGEFTHDKHGRLVITVAFMTDERFCALVALESLAWALMQKSFTNLGVDEQKRIAKKVGDKFAKYLGVKGRIKRNFNKERKALD